MKIGEFVKIEDIGIPALLVAIAGEEVKLELCGEQFWFPKQLVGPTRCEDEEEAA